MSGDAQPSRIPREIWVLVVAAFVIALGYGLIAPVLPQYAKSFDVSLTAASALVSAFALFRLLFAPVSGSLVARLGEPRVYVTGLLIVAVSTGACALATNYTQLLIFRSVGGIGSTMFTVSAMGLIVRLAPPDIRGRVSSAYGSAFLLGNIAGPLLGGVVALLGLRAPFVVYAIALLIAALVVALNLASTHPERRLDPASKSLPILTVADALKDRTFRRVLLSIFANGWTNFGIRVSIVPLLAASLFPGIKWSAAAVLATFAAGNAVALVLAGRHSDIVGRRPFLLGGLFCGAIFTAAFGLSSSLVVLMVVSALAGVGSGLFTPAIQASVADIVGNDRQGGKVLATYQMTGDVGAILGPIVGGQLADRFGFEVAFLVSALILGIAGAVWIGAEETLRRRLP